MASVTRRVRPSSKWGFCCAPWSSHSSQVATCRVRSNDYTYYESNNNVYLRFSDLQTPHAVLESDAMRGNVMPLS